MAVFGKREPPQDVELRQQLDSATAQISELLSRVTQLRGMETPELERQLRELRAAVMTATAERDQVATELLKGARRTRRLAIEGGRDSRPHVAAGGGHIRRS